MYIHIEHKNLIFTFLNYGELKPLMNKFKILHYAFFFRRNNLLTTFNILLI